jgi:hypothetical protein
LRILFVVSIVLFFPLPLVLGIYFNENQGLFFKIYGFKLKFSTILEKIKNHKKKEINNKKRKKTKEKKHKDSLITNLQTIYLSLKKSFMKPYLFISLYNEYGFGDAAIDGIIYGLIYSLSSIPVLLIRSIINLRILKFQVKPTWNEEKFLLKLNIFIFFNISTIIVFLILYFYNTLKLKSKK